MQNKNLANSANDLINILKDPNYCPYCGSPAVNVRRSTKESISRSFGLSKGLIREKKKYQEDKILTKRLICKCEICGKKYYNHGFNMINVHFFDNKFVINSSPDLSVKLRNDYKNKNIQNIIDDIDWQKGALLCQIHKKDWFLSRKHSQPFDFFVININQNILKITTDFVTPPQTSGWGKLHITNINLMEGRRIKHVK